MATAPEEILSSTSGKENFQRITRLLISGGTSLLREIFDSIHPPSNLPMILSNPVTEKQLKAAKLTMPQRHCLCPSRGVYGKSEDFDITLLVRLLRTICNLTAPATGWDVLPLSADQSLTADIARIKYYRNSVYGHVKQGMAIRDNEFKTLWQEISEALVRIAGQISCTRKTAWQGAIAKYLTDPLTTEDERNVQELNAWYKSDMEIKKSMDKVSERISRLEEAVHEGTERMEEISRSIDAVASSSPRALLKLKIDCEVISGPGLQQGATVMIGQPQESQGVIKEGAVASVTSSQSLVSNTTASLSGNIGNGGIPSTQQILNSIASKYLNILNPSTPEDLNGFIQYMKEVRKVVLVDSKPGSLIITVECGSLKILEELWQDYCTGNLGRVVQECLATEDILKEHGLSEIKLITTIDEKDYKDCQKYLAGCRNTKESPLQKEVPTRQSLRKDRAEDSVGSAQLAKKGQKQETSDNQSDQGGMSKPQDVKKKLLGLSSDPGTPVLTAKKSGNRSPGPSRFRNTKESSLQKEVPTRQSPRKHRAADLIGFAQPEKKRQKKDTYGTKSDQGYVQADPSSLMSDTKLQGVKREQPRISPESSPKTLKSTEEQSRNRSPRPSTFKESTVHKVKVPTRRSPRKPRAEDSVGSAQPAKKGQKQETSDNQSDQGAPEVKSPIEVSFALDCSLSVSEKEIQKQIAFVKDMKESWGISLNHVNDYHLVVYGDTAGTIPHDQSTKSFYDHLRELKTGKWSESQCRRMDLALTEAAKCFRSDPNEVYHLIVLMTAGKQGSDKDNEERGKVLLESVAEELYSKKIKVIVVPVGLETDFQELGLIVKRPQYLFPLSSFKDMDSDKAKKIALNIVETVDLEKYAKDAFENFQGIVSPESESALWENIRVCSDVLEGAWYKLYEDSRQEKVKMLIRENIDNFLSTLVTKSKVFITLAVFGSPGTGKSFFLNTLLSLGLDSCKVQNGPLPSAPGKSQTHLPIYIKYGRNVQVSLHKEETDPNPTPCFHEEEIEIGTFDRVKNKLESILKEKDAKYVELQGPFPVFKQLNERKMTSSGLHLELEVDVQFVDVPGLGDKSGDSYVNVALSKADIVLFFEGGKSGREVSAEDIAQIFRRRGKFEFTSRPKLVHIFNDKRPSLSPSETFDGLSKEKKKDLEDAWEHFRKQCNEEDDNYKQVRENIPQLYGELLLEKISRESEVIYFHLKNDKVLDSLKKVVNGHVQTVKRKEIIHPILQKIHWAAKKMRLGVTQRMTTVKKKKKPEKVKPGEVNFEVQSDAYSDDADELIKLFVEKKRDAMLDLDLKSLKEFLFNNFMLSQETQKFLLDMLTDSLVIYTNELIQDFTIRNLPLVEEGPADVIDLIELLCLSRVKNFCTNTAPAYLLHFLKRRQITLTKAETLKWKDASVHERTDLIPSYLSILLERTEELLKKNTRDKQYKKSHFHLMKTLKEIVNELLSARSLHVASWTACLTSLKEKLPIIKDFCEKSIRVINPHPEMNARAILSLPAPKEMKNAKENHKVPSQSSHSQIIDAMVKFLCGTKGKDIIREMETKLKITGKDHGYLKPQEPKQVDQLLWSKALITALSDKDFFNISPQSEDEKTSESSIVLRTDKIQNKELVDQAKKLLFAYKKSSVSCKIVIEDSRHANEIHLRKNDPEKCLEVLVSSTTRQTLDDICKEFKDPSQNLAPIFIPTIRPGSTLDNQGNYFLEEDPWGRVSAEGIRAEEEVEGNQDEEHKTMGKESSGINDGFNQNIFLVVEKQHLITLQNTIDVLGPPKGSKIRLTYVVLPQNGRGIGVTRAIIKSLAECFKFSLYWTVDDDIQFMHHFDQNDRKWHKCSITRGLLFAQRVFQASLQKTTKELTTKERYEVYDHATKDWPDFASDIKIEACSLLMNDSSFKDVQKNLSLLHGPFLNIPEAIRGDKEKEEALRQCEEIFVHKCKERLFEDTVDHIAGVSIAVSTRKSEYMSTYPTADYMPSEQRDKVVLNNTCALKGKNFVTDEVIFDQEEGQVTKKDKQNMAYWGLRDEEKSFNRALTVSGIISYQVIRLVRNHKKLASVH